jgi:hypothetical protein
MPGKEKMTMKADLSDAPEYLKAKHNKKARIPTLFAWLVGVCITLGVLHVGGQAFMQGTLKNLAAKQQKPAPIAEISRPSQERSTSQDWDKIAEEQARRDAVAQPQEAKTTVAPTKQTVFNDQNYKQPDAINVLTFNEPYRPEEPKYERKGVKVTVVKETKDSTCWPLREGSIERRNCKFQTGLNSN